MKPYWLECRAESTPNQSSQRCMGGELPHGEIVGEIYGLTLDGLGEVSIIVPQENLEEAKSILAAGEHGDLMLNDSDAVDGSDPDRS